MAAVWYKLLKINFRALTDHSINSSKLLCETLITGILEARVGDSDVGVHKQPDV